MNIQHFYTLLENPDKQETQLTEIKKICNDYPYFVHPQMLYISYLYQTNDDEFTPALKKIAHTIPDRKFFFQQLIHLSIIKRKKDKNLTAEKDQNTTTTNIAIQHNEPSLQEQVEKEINKTIATSIVQKEIFELEPSIKNKLNEIAPSSAVNDTSIQEYPASSEHQTTFDDDTDDELPNTSSTLANSLSSLLKQYSKGTPTNLPSTSSDTKDLSASKKEKIKQQQEIIDKIIANPVKAIKVNPSPQKFFSAENKAKESLIETEDLVTETLAQIYASQGNIYKAIRAYEILSLKFPQKNTYFAAKIEELKNQLKGKTSP